MDCIRPIQIKVKKGLRAGEVVTVPCGHCMACRIKRTKEWTIRLTMEAEKYGENCTFLTLTYAEDSLPLTPCGKAYLVKKDLQDFFKRLRKRIDVKIKYFACGEYGDTFGRPHYHAILFGKGYTDEDVDDYCKAWQFQGKVDAAPVTAEDIGYVCGYTKKKIYYDKFDEFKEYGCLPSPFQLQSQGLGLDYFMDNAEYFRKRPNFKYRGNNACVPRYFVSKDDKLKTAVDIIAIRRKQSLGDTGDESNPYHNPECLKAHWQHELELRAKFSQRNVKF